MKKIIAAAMAFIFVLLPVSDALAAERETPLIVVSGLGAYPLYARGEDGETYEVMSPDTGELVKALLRGLLGGIFGGFEGFGDALVPFVRDYLGRLSFDADGNSVLDVTTDTFPESLAYYLERGELDYTQYENLLAGMGRSVIASCVKRRGAENTYVFNYDWRLSPLDICDDLRDFIDSVLSRTGADKVDLCMNSHGGALVLAYLARHASHAASRVDSAVFFCTTYLGSYLFGDLFTGGISLSRDMLMTMLDFQLSCRGMGGTARLLRAAYDRGLLNPLFAFADALLDSLLGRIYDEALIPALRCVPGMWSLVPADMFDDAREFMLTDGVSDALNQKIEDFHTIRLNRKRYVDAAISGGVKVSFVSNYNVYCIPLYERCDMQGDGILETAITSGGALVAKYGETLGRDRARADDSCGHCHLSPDDIIDASTCDYPESTWFVKNAIHCGNRYESEYEDFLFFLLDSPVSPTVRLNPKYPQFLQTDDLGRTLGPCYPASPESLQF